MAINIENIEDGVQSGQFTYVPDSTGNVNLGDPSKGSRKTPAGLSQEELSDPNSIKVSVTDPTTPVVVLFGPPACGKTMTLIRMTRYLQSKGFTVEPDRNFRPSYDTNYKDMCDNYDQMVNSNAAADSTSNISFMLVKVLHNGKPICQILEAPGEYYFNPDDPNRNYPTYVYEVIRSSNRKIWAIMIEPDWSDSTPRANYVTRIRNLKTQMRNTDKVLFVYNKIDKTRFVRGIGSVNLEQAITNVKNLYPNIFVPFENQNPITKFFKKYNCEFIPFMTGNYTETMSGGFQYIEGHEVYAQRLWETIRKMING